MRTPLKVVILRTPPASQYSGLRVPASPAAVGAAPEGGPGVAEDALQVAARLKLLLGDSGGVVAIAGVAAGDGSTQLAANLGRAMAVIDQAPVLVMDANANIPTLHKLFSIASGPGLLGLLAGNECLDVLAHPLEHGNLFVLPFGEGRSNLASLMASPQGAGGLAALRKEFRYVFADVGTVLANPENLLLASATDGIVAAIAAGVRRRHEVAHFHQELLRLKIPFFGVVLTKGASRK